MHGFVSTTAVGVLPVTPETEMVPAELVGIHRTKLFAPIDEIAPPSDGGSVQMIPPRSTPNDGRLSATGVSVDPMPGMSYSGVRGAHQPAAIIASRDSFSLRNLRIFAEFPSGSALRSILSSGMASSSRRSEATTTYSPSPDTPRMALILRVSASTTSSMSARRCPDVTPGMSPPAVIV